MRPGSPKDEDGICSIDGEKHARRAGETAKDFDARMMVLVNDLKKRRGHPIAAGECTGFNFKIIMKKLCEPMPGERWEVFFKLMSAVLLWAILLFFAQSAAFFDVALADSIRKMFSDGAEMQPVWLMLAAVFVFVFIGYLLFRWDNRGGQDHGPKFMALGLEEGSGALCHLFAIMLWLNLGWVAALVLVFAIILSLAAARLGYEPPVLPVTGNP